MNDEITKERIQRILFLTRTRFDMHVQACNECQWVEPENSMGFIQTCDQGNELERIIEKWAKLQLDMFVYENGNLQS